MSALQLAGNPELEPIALDARERVEAALFHRDVLAVWQSPHATSQVHTDAA
ncbi:MAG: hypothetical protein ACXVW5_27340 [Solirubrobacteraceae bacterium]